MLNTWKRESQQASRVWLRESYPNRLHSWLRKKLDSMHERCVSQIFTEQAVCSLTHSPHSLSYLRCCLAPSLPLSYSTPPPPTYTHTAMYTCKLKVGKKALSCLTLVQVENVTRCCQEKGQASKMTIYNSTPSAICTVPLPLPLLLPRAMWLENWNCV